MYSILLCIYILVLLYASYVDIKSRVVYNWIHIIILFIATINLIFNFTIFNLLDSILGCIISFIILIIPNFISDSSIGGGDIKLISSSGLLLGLINVLISIFIGFLLMIIIEYSRSIVSKKSIKNKKCALVPYISIGCFFVIAFCMN